MILLPVLLPEGYVAKVSAGDKLVAGQVIAEKKAALASNKTLQIAKFFNTPPKNTQKLLKKHLGDGVLEGDILAVKKGPFGVGSKTFISQFSGTITKIDEETGEITIRVAGGEGTAKTIISPVDGSVEICDNEKIVIKTEKQAVVALDGLGEEGEGEILYSETLEGTKLNKEIAGKVILASVIDKVLVFKAIGLEAVGLITETLEGTDIIELQEKKIIMPILIVNDADFKRLVKQNGKRVYLRGKDKSIVVL
jgi:hypothetical protein